LAATITALILASCNTADTSKARTPVKETKEVVLFEDSMADDWQKNWFLDGKKAALEHRDGGLAFITDTSKVDKRVDRGPFDSQHAVLWTRKEFEGDIRITYTFTKLPGCSWQSLIYVHAQGIGEGPYVKDIYAWRDRREVASMDKYFNYMNLISLSLRSMIHCKRYPWSDIVTEKKFETEFKPRAENKGMPVGKELHCLVEKRKTSILLRIGDGETGEYLVDHTWDLTDEKVLKDRDPRHVEKGRIGLRHMGGHKVLYRNFKVEQL
jgi:hypothetical protein